MIKRPANWDFDNLKVVIPISEKLAFKVKKALKDKKEIVWKLSVDISNSPRSPKR